VENKKKVLKRGAVIGAIVFVVGISGLMAMAAAHHDYVRNAGQRSQERAAQLRKDYQSYLDQMARKITGLPADPGVIAEIQGRHYRESPRTWQYVWATTNAGEFSFGVPAEEFARLNAAWEHYHAQIVKDNHYASRDQFLRTLVHGGGRISLDDDEAQDEKQWRRANDWWRFRDAPFRYDDGTSVAYLSSPIQDGAGKTVGTLNLKVVEYDEVHDRRSFPLREVEPPLAIVTLAALAWLWFLVPTWVFLDAGERGMPRPILWAFLTVLGNVFALVVYLIARPGAPEAKELRCPKCSKALNGAKAGCPYCGADLSSAFCVQCQYPLKSDWAFCPSCRTPIGGATASPKGSSAPPSASLE
jgi:hypothetical protein